MLMFKSNAGHKYLISTVYSLRYYSIFNNCNSGRGHKIYPVHLCILLQEYPSSFQNEGSQKDNCVGLNGSLVPG